MFSNQQNKFTEVAAHDLVFLHEQIKNDNQHIKFKD